MNNYYKNIIPVCAMHNNAKGYSISSFNRLATPVINFIHQCLFWPMPLLNTGFLF